MSQTAGAAIDTVSNANWASGAPPPSWWEPSSEAAFSWCRAPWPATSARPLKVFCVWIAGGLLSLFGALSYAELAAAMPEAGGEYVYLREAYGPIWGFLYGWTQMWVAKSGSIATLATGFFIYLANFRPELGQVWIVTPLPLGEGGSPLRNPLWPIARHRGDRAVGADQLLRRARRRQCASGHHPAEGGSYRGHYRDRLGIASRHPPPIIIPTVSAPGGILGFFAALVGALWAYDGWNNVTMVASEVRKPQRNLPLALIVGTHGRHRHLSADKSGVFLRAARGHRGLHRSRGG